MTVWIAGFVYVIAWAWLFVSIKEKDHSIPVSNDLRAAGYSLDDVTMPLFVVLLLVSVCFFPVTSSAYTVVAIETNRAEYEDGHYVRDDPGGKGQFIHRFEIDEDKGRARLTELTRVSNGTLVDQPVEYFIVSMEVGSQTPAPWLLNPNRRNQKILTLVGKPGLLATETILLGEDFFEYCKATSGRFYLATGVIKRPVSVEQDFKQRLQERRQESQR